MNLIKKIMQLTRPYWPRVFAGIILSLFVSGITAAIAWVVKPALDEVLVNQRYEYMVYVPAGIVILFSAKGIFSFGYKYCMNSAGLKLMRDTRDRLYSHMLYLPAGYFQKESSGVVISKSISDVQMLDYLLSEVLKIFIMEIPTVIFLLGVALYRQWEMTLTMLLLVPLIALSTQAFGKRVKKKRSAAQQKIAVVTQKIGEAVQSIRMIKIFTQEDAMIHRFAAQNRQFYIEMLRVIRLREFTKLAIDMVTGIGVAGAVWYGASLVEKGIVTPGDLASIIVALYMIFAPIKKLGSAHNLLQESRASIERIDSLLDSKHEEQGERTIAGFTKSINFRNVSFAYPGSTNPVLKDINIEIQRGEVIAIVGQSGAGKSTLVDLIPRFNRITGGSLTIDGININELTLPGLRQLIGMVSQDVILFDDTIRENIAFGRRQASEEDIIEASKLAHADEFIRELPDGYNTEIGERGLKLSGGQRQRIAIARAILKNPSILIFDEATSALDSVSESIVQLAIQQLTEGRTTIVIAHRLSTILHSDRIFVMDEGRIIDAGTHNELKDRCTVYKQLYKTFSQTDSEPAG
ncbi:MAG: ABC transporter ATP-binding protein [Nitrospira sp.]|nr:ABC transporter ATP-binding protein [Nitrospira sp.]